MLCRTRSARRHAEMEKYEEFALRSLALLQREGKPRATACETQPSNSFSTIRFYGRAVLSPVLSVQQRGEMLEHRRRAAQLEVVRLNRRRSSLSAPVQVHRVPSEDGYAWPTPPNCPSPKHETVNGYTLVTDSPGLLRDPGCSLGESDPPTIPSTEPTPVSNGYKEEEEEVVKAGRKEEQEKSEDEYDEDEDISLDSLLKRSREYVEKEQSRHGSNVPNRATGTPPSESLSDKENETCSPATNTAIEFGFSLHHSPMGPPHTGTHTRALYNACTHSSVCLAPSLPDPPSGLPSSEPSLSPRTHRRRPRSMVDGNFNIPLPIDLAEPPARSTESSRETAAAAAWGEECSLVVRGSDHWGLVCPDISGGSDSVGGSRRSSHCGASPVQEICSPAGASGHSPAGHHDEHLASAFRRRCHTLDSELYPNSHSPPRAEHIDRSQERAPRFMAGVARLTPSRRTLAAPLNQSYDVENFSLNLLRSHMSPNLAQVKLKRESICFQGPEDLGLAQTVSGTDADFRDCKTGDTHLRVQALEDMQKRLEEEHALQMALLLAEQEKEQLRLRQELEEKQKRLTEPGRDRSLSVDAALSSNVPSPSIQPPVYIWGPALGASKTRSRLSQVLTAEQQRMICRLGAIARGFLTRRLLQTEKVKHLRQTVVDTQEFIRSFQTEVPQKRGLVSAQDLSLQERVRAQLRAALYDVHDIFFEMPLEDRLALLQQDRELCAERKLREMEKAKIHKERAALSVATQRSLDRKKRVGESPGQARKMQQKPKSPTTNRILKPSQGQNAPAAGKLSRQGSWYRKTPEERVRRSDSLKKQHSLG